MVFDSGGGPTHWAAFLFLVAAPWFALLSAINWARESSLAAAAGRAFWPAAIAGAGACWLLAGATFSLIFYLAYGAGILSMGQQLWLGAAATWHRAAHTAQQQPAAPAAAEVAMEGGCPACAGCP